MSPKEEESYVLEKVCSVIHKALDARLARQDMILYTILGASLGTFLMVVFKDILGK